MRLKMPILAVFFTMSAGVTGLIGGCSGGGTPNANNPAGGTSAAGQSAPATWKEAKTKEQQMAFMKVHIMPRMTKVFQTHDEKKYADFSCKSCHGPKYQEPKVFLPKLTMKDGKLTAFTEHAEVSKFMAEKVVPEMAAAMGEKPYDPNTHEGFGCMGCHGVNKE